MVRARWIRGGLLAGPEVIRLEFLSARGLERALLSDDELALREEGWLEFPDPLPAWPSAADLGAAAQLR